MSESLQPAARPTRVRWIIFTLAFSTSWFLYLHRYAWGVIKLDIKEEYGLTDTQLGLLDSTFTFAYAFCQIPSGLLGDLFGPGVVLTTIILLWSGLVAATPLATGFKSFVAVRLAFGVAQAGTYPNLGKVTRNWFPLSIRTTVQGMVASLAGRSGGACAALVVGSLLMGVLGLDWKQTLLAIASVGIVFGVVFRVFFRNTPSEHPMANDAEAALIGTEDSGALGKNVKIRFRDDRRAKLSFVFLNFHIFTSAFADVVFVYWIPMFLLEEKGLSKVEMGIFASLPLFAGALGGMVGGILNDFLIRKTGKLRLARGSVAFTGKVLAALFVCASLAFDDGRWVMVVLAIGKFFTDWSQPTLWGTITDISGRASGRIFGTVNMFGSFGNLAAGPTLGALKQHIGWGAVFSTIAAVFLVSGIVWLWIDPTQKLVDEVRVEDDAADA